MSGGSWDYFYLNMEDVADRLSASTCPERKSLGELMSRMAVAMHEIEWVDSGDRTKGAEMSAIRDVINGPAKPPAEFLLNDARKLIAQLQEFVDNDKEGGE